MSVGAAGGSGSSGGTSSVRSAERSERRDTTQPSAQSQAQFESALRSRQSRHDGDDSSGDGQDDDRSDQPAEGSNALAANFAPPLPLRGQNEEAPVAQARPVPTQSGTQLKMEAALNANVAPAITEVGANDPAALWEASVRDPNAIPLEVRVLRGERIGNEANAALTVSVRSTNVSGDVLARHASKLDERLRKRGVDGMHVRIEDGEEPA